MKANACLLGSFELKELLGSGGQARVWRATSRSGRTVGFPVAVKVLSGERSRSEAAHAMFRREIQGVAALDHPNIVQVFDHGLVSEEAERASEGDLQAGSPWLAMELVRGSSMTRIGPPWSVLKTQLLALLGALAHAHARGIVHRDVKPSNVFVGPDGLKLGDFGLAFPMEGDLGGAADSRVLGTPAYMAPEQIECRHRDYGPWTDLYSLGCMAWAIVSGKPPFGRDTYQDVLMAHLHTAPPDLVVKSPVPPKFEAWLRKLMEKNPSRRFRWAADAALGLRDLDRIPFDQGDGVEGPEVRLHDLETSVPQTLTTMLGPLEVPILSGPRQIAPWLAPLEAPSEEPSETWRRPSFTDTWLTKRKSLPGSWMSGVGLSLFGLRDPPLVARTGVRNDLWQCLGRVHAQGRTRVVVVRGPSGVGKSRLARWLCERSHELGAAESMRAQHHHRGHPLDGLGPMLARKLGCQGLSGEEVLERIRELLAPETNADANEVKTLAGLVMPRFEPGNSEVATAILQTPEVRYACMERCLERFTRDRPLVLCLDDAQWSLDALGLTLHLLNSTQAKQTPVLVLLTLRDDELAGNPIEASWVEKILAYDEVDCLRLETLQGPDARRLVKELSGLEERVATRVAQRTGGNPLFAVQLVSDWVQRGLLIPTRDGFTLKPGESLDLPDGLHEVWATRLSRVLAARDEGDKIAVEAAAALGPEVNAHEFKHLCLLMEVEPSSDLIDVFVGQGLARRNGLGDGWGFANDILRESVERNSREANRWPRIN